MSKLYYFAYGSNLHPLRLQKRVPSATFKALAPMHGYRLCFHKLHDDDKSGKCNMLLTDQSEDIVYGAIYEMKQSEKPLLDKFEGVGYRCDTLQVNFEQQALDCFVYIAEESHINDSLRPHSWYHKIVLLGAEHHQLPDTYINQIKGVLATEDPDSHRHETNFRLIKEMLEYAKGK